MSRVWFVRYDQILFRLEEVQFAHGFCEQLLNKLLSEKLLVGARPARIARDYEFIRRSRPAYVTGLVLTPESQLTGPTQMRAGVHAAANRDPSSPKFTGYSPCFQCRFDRDLPPVWATVQRMYDYQRYCDSHSCHLETGAHINALTTPRSSRLHSQNLSSL